MILIRDDPEPESLDYALRVGLHLPTVFPPLGRVSVEPALAL